MRNEFEAILDDNPEDWEARLVYADWLDEQGEEILANGQRWQARNRRTPHVGVGFSWWAMECLKGDWGPSGHKRKHTLPANVTRAIGKNYQGRSRLDVEAALAETLHELREG